METKDLKQLIQLLEASNLESLSYKDKNFEFEIKKQISGTQTQNITKSHSSVNEQQSSVQEEVIGKVIKSPLVGIFYSKPSVEGMPFVNVGSKVSQGDPLCVLEAMKVMNEIKSSMAGEIVEIYVKDGDPVDYDQPLFRLIWESFKKYWLLIEER